MSKKTFFTDEWATAFFYLWLAFTALMFGGGIPYGSFTELVDAFFKAAFTGGGFSMIIILLAIGYHRDSTKYTDRRTE